MVLAFCLTHFLVLSVFLPPKVTFITYRCCSHRNRLFIWQCAVVPEMGVAASLWSGGLFVPQTYCHLCLEGARLPVRHIVKSALKGIKRGRRRQVTRQAKRFYNQETVMNYG